MDNPLTPNKIQRLMHLAEDKSFNAPRRLHQIDENFKCHPINPVSMNKTNAESSSGIIDLERVEGFGESGIGDFSLSKSTAFNPGEMTGRSTGADDMNVKPIPLGRHSLALESITSQMDKQTCEIQDIMRHSIASNYSFHSKRDLTADEASLVAREAPIPMQNITHTQFTETSMNNSNLSMGAYFKNRCPEFGKILTKTDSPNKSYLPPILDASPAKSQSSKTDGNPQKIDQTLDCIPVRQPRNIIDIPEKQNHLTKAENALQNEPSCSKVDKQELFYMSQVLDKPKYVQMSLDSSPRPCNKVPNSINEHNLIMKLQNSLRLMNDDTEGSTENSLSISKIADFLGKQSNVSLTEMLLYNNQKKHLIKKQPLTELHMNIPEKKLNQDIQVTNLKDTRKTETASTSSTVNTVLEGNKYRPKDAIPEIVLTQSSLREEVNEIDDNKSKRTTRSKSPSSKSHSTLSTVQENFTSFKSSDSPLHTSKGEPNTSHVPSPNIVYKELDKSVDWDEVLREKHMKQEGLAKEQWADVVATPANGYVGVSTPVTLTVTTLTDSWLTAKLQFDNSPHYDKDITFELPRQPLLLSPGKSEKIIINITSNIELQGTLKFTLFLKDACVDGDITQKGDIEVNIKLPVIQAMSCDGINKVVFQPIQEMSGLTKSFVLLSDCSVDLQLVLSVVEGDSMFAIKTVQEIKKSDVNKVLMDRQGSTDDGQKVKSKAINKQLCRLSSGNAIRVTIQFNAPKLAELQIIEPIVTFNGLLNVSLIGVNTLLRKIDLIGVVGSVNLTMNAPASRLHLTNEPTNIELVNTGSIAGTWYVKFKTNTPDSFPFKISPSKFEIRPGSSKIVTLMYTGTGEGVHEATVSFEDIATGNKKSIDIYGGNDRPKTFPIKTNYTTMSWVRPGRKELSLKNGTDKKIYIRCQILGEGFLIDLPRETRGREAFSVPFGPCECRPLPIVFAPTTNGPQMAVLHIVSDKNSELTRKIQLYGCASGESMRWSGLVTYGETALVRAISRNPINLELYNKSSTAAFVCARVHFNLQYMCVASTTQLLGSRRVVPGRARHSVVLRVDWPRIERRAREPQAATALATLTVLTGAEFTRRRILKIVKDESNGELDTSLLPDHLKVLADKYDGEDPSMDRLLADFQETRASLNELIGGLQEMTAQIDLPQDYSDENTIIISDDTVIEHHTLCDD